MEAGKQRQDVVVRISKRFGGLDVNLPRLEKLVKDLCLYFQVYKAVINVEIVDDAHIRQLNKQFLNHNCPTDCLSFDLSDGDNLSPKSFDLMVNAEMAVREAKLRGHSGEAELALYVTHGLLHNFGFDDSTQQQAKKMHDTENKILQQQGFDLVYNAGNGC